MVKIENSLLKHCGYLKYSVCTFYNGGVSDTMYFETPRNVSAILFILHAYISSPVSMIVFHSNKKECQGNMEKCENTECEVFQTGSDLQCSSSRQNGRPNPIDLH